MENKEVELSDEDVKLKISICGDCNNIVRSAVEHKMTLQMKNEFKKEVFEYDLSIKTISLKDYRDNKPDWCECE